jgi:hypothetical protein
MTHGGGIKMTTTIYYQGNAYELAHATQPLPVDVEQISANMPAQVHRSSCNLTYCIIDNQLILRDVLVLESNRNTLPHSNEVYRELAQTIPYTGKLLLVRDFFKHNMVSQVQNAFMRIEAYDTIVELVFEKGELVCTIDHSPTMSALRGVARKWRKTNSELDFLSTLSGWIQAIYGFEYDVWWLPSTA